MARIALSVAMSAAIIVAVVHATSSKPSLEASDVMGVQGKNEITGFNPDPSVLKWTKGTPGPGQMVYGELTVHLDPANPDSPTVTLEVAMTFAKAATPLPPIFIHAGGPGSDATQGIQLHEFFSGLVDVMAISQRGIGPKASPKFLCEGRSKLPAQDPCSPDKDFKTSDFTDCPCALPDGMPQFGETWADVNPTDKEEVEAFLGQMEKWTMKCYQADKFKMNGSDGKEYNFLDFTGTGYLVQDIDTFRKAIGAPKIKFLGMSYGTLVGAAYATMFPNSTSRMMLDGNMMPVPQKFDFAEAIAANTQKTIAELVLNCERNQDTCSLKDPQSAYAKVLDLAGSGKLTAKTNQGKPFALKLGMLQNYLQITMNSGAMAWPAALSAIASLASSNATEVESAVEKILDGWCVVKGKPTWSAYGVCVGAAATMEIEDKSKIGPFIEGVGVLGADLAGRYLVKDAIQAWSFVSGRFSSPALSAFLGCAGVMLWPAVPSPVPPIGNADVDVLVIGNLYDSSTAYKWAQQMAAVFPKGALVTWQGVGHLLAQSRVSSLMAGQQQAFLEANECFMMGLKFLIGHPQPRDGTICRRSIPVATA